MKNIFTHDCQNKILSILRHFLFLIIKDSVVKNSFNFFIYRII